MKIKDIKLENSLWSAQLTIVSDDRQELERIFENAGKVDPEKEYVMAWMDLPLPYKTKNKCSNCKHREEWCDEFGDRWEECDLRKNVPIKPEMCPLGR